MEKLSTAKRLFLIRYQVRLPAYLVENPNSAKGVARSEDKHVAEMEASQLVHVNWAPYRLAMLVEAGWVPDGRTFVNLGDTLKMYEAIADHIKAWNRAINERMHKLEAPHNDLVLFDELASMLWPFARRQRAVDINENTYDNKAVEYIMRRSNKGDSKTERINQLEMDHKSDVVDSLSEAIKRRSTARRGRL